MEDVNEAFEEFNYHMKPLTTMSQVPSPMEERMIVAEEITNNSLADSAR